MRVEFSHNYSDMKLYRTSHLACYSKAAYISRLEDNVCTYFFVTSFLSLQRVIIVRDECCRFVIVIIIFLLMRQKYAVDFWIGNMTSAAASRQRIAPAKSRARKATGFPRARSHCSGSLFTWTTFQGCCAYLLRHNARSSSRHTKRRFYRSTRLLCTRDGSHAFLRRAEE